MALLAHASLAFRSMGVRRALHTRLAVEVQGLVPRAAP